MQSTILSILTAGLLLALVSCGESDTSLRPSAASTTPGSVSPLEEALRLPDAYARAEALGALLPKLDVEALPEVKETLGNFRAELGPVEFDLLLRFWANQNPEEAMTWVLKSCPVLYRTNAARTTIEILARRDPAKAVAASQSSMIDSDEISRVTQIALVQGWYERDRTELLQYIRGLGTGIPRQRGLYAYALSLIGDEGSEAAIHWAEAVPEDDKGYKQSVFQQMVAALSWADSPAAVRFCDAHCDGPYASGLREVLIRARLNRGEYGGDVVEWIARAAEERDEQRVAKSHSLWVAYSTWAYWDHQAAKDWMARKLEQPQPEPWLKRLYGEYARQVASDDPARAIVLAEQIEDEAERTLTMVRIARYWRTRDEAAAESWLAQSPLDEKSREQARNTRMPINLPRVAPVMPGPAAN
jgi:hypothetical protein